MKGTSPGNVYALINETLGFEFCSRLGLPLPPCKVVRVPQAYFDDPRTRFPATSTRRQLHPGSYFLSRFVPDTRSSKCYELLPSVWLSRVTNKDACLGMFVFDVWADHRDKRQALFSETGSGLGATFIDNTHLFGGPNRNDPARPRRLSAAEVVALSAAADHRQMNGWIDVVRQTMSATLDRTLDLVPQEWQEVQASDPSFEGRFRGRLEHLEELVHSALDRASSFAPAFRSQIFCFLPEDEAPSVLPLV